MIKLKTYLLLAFAIILTACTGSQVKSDSVAKEPAAEPTSRVVLTSEVRWEKLNPARGDKSPLAGTLWGDRNGSGPTGFLVKFVDGFSSPPHIHNVSYRGVVISGLIHNDDPGAKNMWMPAGSFWTQPAGEAHITAAKGNNNIAYIEIDEGPYLVRHTDEAFDNGERPVNIDKSNLVWLDASDIKWIDSSETPASSNGPKMAFLWSSTKEGKPGGYLVKLPTGFTGFIRSHGSTLRAVVIQDRLQYKVPGETDIKTLEPGSYFSSNGESAHQVSCKAGEDCVIYVRAEGKFDVVPAQPNR